VITGQLGMAIPIVEKIIGTILPIGVMEDTGVVTALTSAIPEQITNMIITCTLL